MKKVWLTPCCALELVLCAGPSHAAFWQVVRDTPVRSGPAAETGILGIARKGWILNDMLEGKPDPGRKWIEVIELQTKSGGRMAYAHLLFETPGRPVYVSTAAVVQVTDAAGTPLQGGAASKESGNNQESRVSLLPPVQTEDWDFGGAVDEAALRRALEAWVQACNAVLAPFENMDADTAALNVIRWDGDTFFSGRGRLEESVRPLLERWAESQYGADASGRTLSAGDSSVLEMLAGYGLVPAMAEGSGFLQADLPFFRRRIALDGQGASFIRLLDSQPQLLCSDGGCRYPVRQMGLWALEWETYLKNLPAGSPFLAEGKKRYREFVTHILLSTLPNTPAFPRFNQGRMEKQWMADLEGLARDNPGTETARLISDFLKRVKANGGRLSEPARKHVLDSLDALFVSGAAADGDKTTKPSKAGPASLKSAEQKLPGRHAFSRSG